MGARVEQSPRKRCEELEMGLEDGRITNRWGIGKLGGDGAGERLVICWNQEEEEGSSLQEDLDKGLGNPWRPVATEDGKGGLEAFGISGITNSRLRLWLEWKDPFICPACEIVNMAFRMRGEKMFGKKCAYWA